MMEKSDSGEAHNHIVLVTCLDDYVISLGSAGLSDVLNSALTCSLYIVSEGEECIGTTNNIRIFSKPCLLFLSGEYGRLLSEDGLPCSLGKYVLVLISDVEIDGIVSVRTLDGIKERKIQNLRCLTKEPVICFVSCKSCAVDS